MPEDLFDSLTIDFRKLADSVVESSRPVARACSICGGQMALSIQLDCGKDVWACAMVRALPLRGDYRIYDPAHYEKSKVTLPRGIDFDALRNNMMHAFGQIEGMVEKRVREPVVIADTEDIVS